MIFPGRFDLTRIYQEQKLRGSRQCFFFRKQGGFHDQSPCFICTFIITRGDVAVYDASFLILSGNDEIREEGGEDEEAVLRPMPFSVKMRELMVWTTNTVLPALAGLPGDVADGMVGATPGECPLFCNASKVLGTGVQLAVLAERDVDVLLVCPLHFNVFQTCYLVLLC